MALVDFEFCLTRQNLLPPHQKTPGAESHGPCEGLERRFSCRVAKTPRHANPSIKVDQSTSCLRQITPFIFPIYRVFRWESSFSFLFYDGNGRRVLSVIILMIILSTFAAEKGPFFSQPVSSLSRRHFTISHPRVHTAPYTVWGNRCGWTRPGGDDAWGGWLVHKDACPWYTLRCPNIFMIWPCIGCRQPQGRSILYIPIPLALFNTHTHLLASLCT